jgi:hypothetical protein
MWRSNGEAPALLFAVARDVPSLVRGVDHFA